MNRLFGGRKYDEVMRNRACVSLGLRVIVAGYIIYLAWGIASGKINGESSMQLWCVILFCSIFVIAAIAFAIYAVRSFIKAMKEAEIKESGIDVSEESGTDGLAKFETDGSEESGTGGLAEYETDGSEESEAGGRAEYETDDSEESEAGG